MKASDVMTTDVISVDPEMKVLEAAKLMLDRRISGVPVIDKTGQLAGILTEGDMMRRAELATGRPWWLSAATSAQEKAVSYTKGHGLKVGDVMTREVLTLQEDEPLDRIAMLFEERGIKRAPVVRHGKVVGIVSRANLLQGVVAGKSLPGPRDEEIRSAILTRAPQEAGIRDALISVTVGNGVVHLWGNLASQEERDALRVVAETTEGVREVRDHLRLIPSSIGSWQPE